ncbi:MAG: type VI secretion system-associated protein TagF [Pseudomonadota bacterium]
MQDVFGVFGKIPSLGDFLRVGLPAAFVTVWDTWLQAEMSAARAALGEHWTDAYMSAPIWRFSLPRGAAGERPVSGVLLPSVDRVGRQYPLTLAVVHHAPCPASAHFANTELFEQLETLAISVLDEEIDRDGLIAATEGLTFVIPPAIAQTGRTYRFGAATPKTALAGAYVAQVHPGAALWTTVLDGDARLMASQGLPRGGDALGLFTLAATVWPQPRPEAAQ